MPSSNTTLPSSRPLFGPAINRLFPLWVGLGELAGLMSPQTGKLTGTLAAYNAAVDNKAAAAEANRQASATLAAAERAARRAGNASLRTIRGFAEASADPAAVYRDAQVAEPRPSAPLPAPASPGDIQATLRGDGVVKVRWPSPGPRVFFTLRRELHSADGLAATEAVYAGTERTFLDATVPAGTVRVQYQVRAGRAGKTGPWSDAAVLSYVAAPGAGEPGLRLAA